MLKLLSVLALALVASADDFTWNAEGNPPPHLPPAPARFSSLSMSPLILSV